MFNVSVTNSGTEMSASAGEGSASGGLIEALFPNVWHALSSDGSRAYFTSPIGSGAGENFGRNLYVRVNIGEPQSPVDGQGVCTVAVDACTIEVSASQRKVPDPHGPFPARYRGASADGSKVFFTSRMELTEDAHTGPEDDAGNLYEYDLASGRLTDLTVDTSDPEGAGVLGVAGMSEDASVVYFVAKGDLTGEEENGHGAKAVAGQANLYVIREGSAPKFIATLHHGSEEKETDESEDGEGDANAWTRPLSLNNAAVTANGTHFAFVSQRSLTGYNNEWAPNSEVAPRGECYKGETHNLCTEVYTYDLSSGSLTCVSCNPTGARPIGNSSLTKREALSSLLYRERHFSEDGSRFFFQSYDSLVAHDGNGRQDVYEYSNGHVAPISNVAGGYESYFLDSSPDGRDVFFATYDQLLPQDKDLRLDIYDARTDGGFPVSVAAPVCSNGDACKPPPNPQPAVFGAPASATFSGAGNLAPVPVGKPAVKQKGKGHPKKCKKGSVRKHGRCVKRGVKGSGVRSKRGSK